MKLHWPHLDSNESGKRQNAGNTGNSGNTPEKIGVSSVSAVGNTLETLETKPNGRAQAVSNVSGPETTPETQKGRENGCISAVSNVSAQKSVSKCNRPTPEELATWGEYLLERASVMEHDGELPRTEADARAWRELLNKYPAAATCFGSGGEA